MNDEDILMMARQSFWRKSIDQPYHEVIQCTSTNKNGTNCWYVKGKSGCCCTSNSIVARLAENEGTKLFFLLNPAGERNIPSNQLWTTGELPLFHCHVTLSSK